MEQRLKVIALYSELLHTIKTLLHAEVVEAVAAGVPRRRIAREGGPSERTVRRLIQRNPVTENGPTTATATPGGALITPDKTRSNP